MENIKLTDEIANEYKIYLLAAAKADAAKKEMDKAKAKIIKFHRDHGAIKIDDRGFKSTLSVGTRETLIKEAIEKLFGKIPDSCKKTTVYDSIRISGTVVA